MRIETLIFIVVIVLMAAASSREKFVVVFTGMITFMTALYLSFWQLEIFSSYVALLSFVPEGYERTIAFLLSFFLFFMLIKGIMTGVRSNFVRNYGTDVSVFPRLIEISASVLCGSVTGLCMATLLFLTAVMMPVTSKLVPDSFTALKDNAKRGIRIVSFIEDTASFQPDFRKERDRMLSRFLSNAYEEDQEFLSANEEELKN